MRLVLAVLVSSACADDMPPGPDALSIEPTVGPDDRPTPVVVSGEFTALRVAVGWSGGSEVEEATALVGGEILGEMGTAGASSLRGNVPILPIGAQRLEVVDPFGQHTSREDAFCVLSPAAQVRTIVVSGSAGARAGESFTIELEARGDDGKTVERFDGAVELQTPSEAKSVAFSRGSWTGDIVSTVAGTSSVVAVVDLAGDPCAAFVDPGEGSAKILIEPGPSMAIAFSTPPQSVVAGDCSSAVSVGPVDEHGNPSTVALDVGVQIQAEGPTSLFADSRCGTPLGATALTPASPAVTFYFTSDRAGLLSITATSALGMAEQVETILPAASSRLVFASGPGTVGVGTAPPCSAPFTLEVRDRFGNPTARDLDSTIVLSASSPNVQIWDASCTQTTASVVIPRGTANAQFAVAASSVGVYELTAVDPVDDPDPTTSLTVTPGTPSQVVFVTPPVPVLAGACSSVRTIEARDSLGSPTPVFETFSLTSLGATFFADASCAAPITDIATQGAASASFYFSSVTAGTVMLEARAQIGFASQTETILASDPVALAIAEVPSLAAAGQCFRLRVESRDAAGNPSPVPLLTPIAASSAPSTIQFFTDAACATPGVGPIQGGTSSVLLFGKGGVAGPTAIIVSDPSLALSGDTAVVDIQPGIVSTLVFTSPPQLLTAGTCASAIVEWRDSFGNPVPLAAASAQTTFTTGAVTFYTDASCTMPDTTHFALPAATELTFYFVATAAVPTTLLVDLQAPGTVSASQIEAINADVPVALVYETPPQTVLRGTCSGPVVIGLRDQFGNPANSSSLVTLTVLPTGASVLLSNAPGCSSAALGFEIAGGLATTTLYFRPTTPDVQPSMTLTVSSPSLMPASQTHAIVDIAPNRLVFQTGPVITIAGACTSVSVEAVDPGGAPLPVAVDTTVSLSASPNVAFRFYDAGACQQGGGDISEVTILSGESVVTFDYLGELAGPVDISVFATGYAGATQTELIVAAEPIETRFISPPKTMLAGACSGPFFVGAFDEFGNSGIVSSDIVLALAAAPATTFVFHTDPSCTSPVTSIPFNAGETVAIFFAYGELATNVAITATGLGADTQVATVLPDVPSQLSFVTPPRIANVLDCSLTLEVETQDRFGNQSPVAFDTTAGISHSGPPGFDTFVQASCTLVTNTIMISSGTARGAFHFFGTSPASVPITVSNTSLGQATQNAEVTAGPPMVLAFSTPPRSAPAGVCSGVVGIETVDATMTPAPVVQDTTVSISGGLTFFSDATCTVALLDVVIPAGASSASFHFTGAAPGFYVVGIAATGLLGTFQVETILAAVCGNGMADFGETCDDGNTSPTDGCSALCLVEPGFQCIRFPSFCAAEAQTAFVDDDTCPLNGAGTVLNPYCQLDSAVASGLPNIIIRPGLYSESVQITSGDRRIAAEDGAVLDSPGGAETLGVTGTAIVKIIGLQVTGGGTETIDLDNSARLSLEDVRVGPSPAIGINGQGDAFLSMQRTWIRDTADGLILDDMTTWNLSSSIISGSADDGVDIFSAGGGSSIIQSLTIAGNAVLGIDCQRPINLTGVILWDNGTSYARQCNFVGSDVEGGAPGNNIDVDPLFTLDGTFHLQPTSPCIDAVNSGPPSDFDGELRPRGLGFDIGADEF